MYLTRVFSRQLSRKAIVAASLLVATLATSALLASSAQAATHGWRLIGATGPTNLPPFNSEIQRLLVNAEGGTYTLRFEGDETQPIPFDANPSELNAALEALPAIGAGNVEVSGGPGDASATSPYFIRFVGSLAMTNVGQIGAEPALLTGAGHIASVSTVTQGDTPGQATLAIYATNVGGAPTSGAIKVAVGPLPAGITATTSLGGNGTGWTCAPAGAGQSSVECQSSATVTSGHTAKPLTLPLSVAANAPATSSVAITVHGGGATAPGEGLYEYEEPLTVSNERVRPGIEAFWAGAFNGDGTSATQAGGHPNLAATGFLVNTNLTPAGRPEVAGDLRTVNVELPPGFIGNPLVTASRCPQNEPIPTRGPLCGEEALVGYSGPVLGSFAGEANENANALKTGVYNAIPPFGYPADFPFEVGAAVVGTLPSLRSDADYGITIAAPELPQTLPPFGSFLTLFDSPTSTGGKAFLTNPADCAEEAATAPTTTVSDNSWQDQNPSAVDNELTVTLPPVTGCSQLAGKFNPSFSFQPNSHEAASPSAFTAELEVPQEGLTDPEGLAAPELKKAVVALPAGLAVNPAAANGLQTCSESQIGLLGTNFAAPNPIRFNKTEPGCPEASELGTVEARTPLLEETLEGTIYLASQEENPFHSLFALYLVVNDPKDGILVKLPGEVRTDSQTGQLTAVFDNNPQLPVSSLKLSFRGGGPQSPLATPEVCGTYTTHGEWTPWSAPESGPAAQTENSFQVTSGPGGSGCASSKAARPFAPAFEAGTTSVAAGSYSPLALKITTKDGEQELKNIDLTLPKGLLGKLAGVPECSQASVNSIPTRQGTGRSQLANPSCPASSQIGTVQAGAGIGGSPIYVSGKLYLAGPYQGAPFSVVAVTPAVTGPFDLGNVVVQAGLYIDPSTAQVTVKTSEIPSILDGVPLQLRSIAIEVNRPGFTLNPTSCEKMQINATLVGAEQSASATAPFQVGGCQNLAFKPALTATTQAKTSKADGASLVVKVSQKAGEANIHKVDLTVPIALPARLTTLQKACLAAQFEANPAGCPAASVIGTATANTPLLNVPLTGPAYLVSHGGAAFPDVEFELQGEGITIDLDGKTDIKKGITYSKFETVPDAPISSFTATLPEGPHSIFTATGNLCTEKPAIPTTITGQNGAVLTQSTKVAVTGCAKAKKLTRAQKLKAALKVCKKDKKKAKRAKCEKQARKKYGPLKKKAKAKGKGGKKK